jgi:hypothetical protein
MVGQNETYARALVQGLYFSTNGKPFCWSLPSELNDVTRRAIQRAADCGWIFVWGHNMCLTTAGLELAKKSIKTEPQ